MAKITSMVGQDIIDGFKGVIDYYVYMGQPCARAWPKSPGKMRSPAVMSTWPAFGYAAGEWKNLSPFVKRAYEEQATGTAYTGRDLFQSGYLKGLYRNPIP